MEKNSPPNRRLEWRAEVQHNQNVLDLQMAELAEYVELHNSWIRALYEHGHTDESDEPLEHITSSLNLLNEQWVFHNDFLIIAGSWIEPELEWGTNGFQIEASHKDVFRSAQSAGFGVFRDEETNYMQIGLKFLTEKTALRQMHFDAAITEYAYARPEEISLTYLRPPTYEVLATDEAEIERSMRQFDAILRMHMHDPASEFYRKSAAVQKKFLRSLVDDLNETLPDPRDMDTVEVEDVHVDRMYVIDQETRSKLIRLQAPTSKIIELSGKLRGFQIPELIEESLPLRSHEDIFDQDGGICMAVELTQINTKTQMLPAGTVLVPIHRLKRLQLKAV